MVVDAGDYLIPAANLSVLALSSRFDGHTILAAVSSLDRPFSTRSVESF